MPDERTQANDNSLRDPHVVVLLTALSAASPQHGAGNDNSDLVDAKGNIRKPEGYRDRYQVLGA